MKPSNDREAVLLILQGITEKGCKITGVQQDDWNPNDVTPASTPEEATNLVMEVDIAVVHVNLPEGSERVTSHILFVLGNDPEEVAADYGISMEPFIDPITDPWWE